MTVISYHEWFESGRTRQDLRNELASGSVRKVRRSMLTDVPASAGPREQHLARVRAAARFLGPRTYFSRFSAAAIHGLPLMNRRYEEVTVYRAGGGHGSVAPTIHARRAALSPDDVTELDGLPVTSLARTVADLIRELPFAEAVMVADAALGRKVPRLEIGELISDGRGCRLAATALAFADGDAESPGESLSRVRMWEGGLVMPVLQHVVVDHDGTFLGRTDFYWEHCDTAGEFDGEAKYGELAGGRSPTEVIMEEKRRQGRIGDVVNHLTRWTWPEIDNGVMVRRLAGRVGFRQGRRIVLPGEGHRWR
ncbi:MAG: hypothetical protein QM779_16550 [Propionicimonas sp.]|uniref:hypothetical protein n=1 Tax=Propionicimonas sp. TaxID=1955623 RepID=UPI003D0FC305